MTPWLTVVMPVHEGGDFLEATLASVTQDDNAGCEFLIFNSASDGGVAERIAASFASRISIRWRDTPDLQSWQAKTNLGVREASGSHVVMLHQDDLWLPGHLSAIRRVVSRQPDAALSIAPSQFVDPKGREIGRWRLPFGPGAIESGEFLKTLLVQNSIAIPSAVIRRDAWLRVGGLDETLWYTADWDLYLKLADAGPVVVRTEVTTAFRLHRNSLTMVGSRATGAFRKQLEQVLTRHIGRVPEKSRNGVERLARVSLGVNCALAVASAGTKRALLDASLHFLSLGPREMILYLRHSRIIDRLSPRLRLAWAGSF